MSDGCSEYCILDVNRSIDNVDWKWLLPAYTFLCVSSTVNNEKFCKVKNYPRSDLGVPDLTVWLFTFVKKAKLQTKTSSSFIHDKANLREMFQAPMNFIVHKKEYLDAAIVESLHTKTLCF